MDLSLAVWCFSAFIFCFVITNVRAQCQLNPTLEHDDVREGGLRSQIISVLNGLPADFRNHEHRIQATKNKDVTYVARICPDHKGDHDHEEDHMGMYETYDKDKKRTLGRCDATDVANSTKGDVLYLAYSNGDKYGNACNKSERRVMIYVRPELDTSIKEPRLAFLNEAAGTDEDFCYYMFELFLPKTAESSKILKYTESTPSGSDKKPTDDTTHTTPASLPVPHADDSTTPSPHHGISAGSLVLLLTLIPALVLIAVGSVYKRFVMGAQGWEQVPFIDFWRRCGSLQADGVRHVFGRRGRGGSRYDDYSPVSTDEERQPALTSPVNDDHLLPM